MSKKLLLADDSITIQKVIGITFANEDYELSVVGNGDAGLEKAQADRPDLILADVFMPGKNGYELCAAVKQDPALRHIPVLLLTGTFEPFDEAKAKACGADSWIAKPFESQALIERVEKLLAAGSSVSPTTPPAAPAAAEVRLEAPAAEEELVLEDPFGVEEEVSAAPETELEAEAVAPIPADADTGDDLWAGLADEPAPAPAEEPWQAPTPGADDDSDLWLEGEGEQPGAGEVPEEEVWGELAAEEIDSVSIDEPMTEEAEEAFIFEEEDPFALTGEEIADQPEASAEVEWNEFDEEILPLDEEDIIEEEMLEEIDAGDALLAGEMPPTGSAPEAVPVPGVEEEPDWEFDVLPDEETGAAVAGEIEWEFAEEPVAEAVIPAVQSPAAAREDLWGMPEESGGKVEGGGRDLAEEPPARPAVAPEREAATVEAKVAALSEEEIAAIVEKVAGSVIERLAHTLLERIAWEVVPDLAESLIRDEIRKIKEGIQDKG